jgi:hypothetical protein
VTVGTRFIRRKGDYTVPGFLAFSALDIAADQARRRAHGTRTTTPAVLPGSPVCAGTQERKKLL